MANQKRNEVKWTCFSGTKNKKKEGAILEPVHNLEKVVLYVDKIFAARNKNIFRWWHTSGLQNSLSNKFYLGMKKLKMVPLLLTKNKNQEKSRIGWRERQVFSVGVIAENMKETAEKLVGNQSLKSRRTNNSRFGKNLPTSSRISNLLGSHNLSCLIYTCTAALKCTQSYNNQLVLSI